MDVTSKLTEWEQDQQAKTAELRKDIGRLNDVMCIIANAIVEKEEIGQITPTTLRTLKGIAE